MPHKNSNDKMLTPFSFSSGLKNHLQVNFKVDRVVNIVR